MKKVLSILAWMLISVTPLIEIGGLLISHGAIGRVTIAVVLYIAGCVWGFMLGVLWNEGGLI